MIILNSVSKSIGKGEFKRTILRDVNWLIRPRTRVVILGQHHSGASALTSIIAGMTLPTSGWVDRQAIISIPNGLLRYAMRDTTRQLVLRLSRLYRVDADEVSQFIVEGLETQDVLNVPPRSLPLQLKQQLSIALTYAFPCDFYVFNNSPIGAGEPNFQAFCHRALELRSRQAGIIIQARSGRVARKLDHDMMGALVYRGHMTLYKRLTDAITVFENLPPEESDTTTGDFAEDQALQEDEQFQL